MKQKVFDFEFTAKAKFSGMTSTEGWFLQQQLSYSEFIEISKAMPSAGKKNYYYQIIEHNNHWYTIGGISDIARNSSTLYVDMIRHILDSRKQEMLQSPAKYQLINQEKTI